MLCRQLGHSVVQVGLCFQKLKRPQAYRLAQRGVSVYKIEVQALTKTFGTEDRGAVLALDDISLTVEEGEFISIVGPSGCGKSTLLYTIAGFLKCEDGVVLVDGIPVTGPSMDRGVVFQEYALFPWRTVVGNISYGLESKGITRRERERIVARYVEHIGLSGFEHCFPKELSGGMKQRVAIARTLAYEPDILLMDEPFGALDAQTRELMQDQLLDIWRETGKTVLLVTHDVSEAVFLSQRVVVMTSRPGRKKAEFPITIGSRRSREETMVSDEFNRVRNQIWLAVREEALRTAQLA